MTDPFAKLYRRLRSDPRWRALGDAASKVLVEYVMLAYPFDGDTKGCVCKPGQTASGLTTQPLSQAQRAKAVGRSRGALRRIEAELEEAGCITLRSLGQKRPTVVCLAPWCTDETSEHDSQRVMMAPGEHDSQRVMDMTPDESCCAENMTHGESCTGLTASHVAADKPKGPLASSGAREDVREVEIEKGGEKDGPRPPRSPVGSATADGNGGAATAGEQPTAAPVQLAPGGGESHGTTATAPVSETESGDGTAPEEDLLHLVARLTGETVRDGTKGRERVDSIVAPLSAEIARGTVTDAEAREGLAACPPRAGQWGSEYVPEDLLPRISRERERRRAERRRAIVARIDHAESLPAKWAETQAIWAEYPELAPTSWEDTNPWGEPYLRTEVPKEWLEIQQYTLFMPTTEHGLRLAIGDEWVEHLIASGMTELKAASAEYQKASRKRKLEEMQEKVRAGDRQG